MASSAAHAHVHFSSIMIYAQGFYPQGFLIRHFQALIRIDLPGGYAN